MDRGRSLPVDPLRGALLRLLPEDGTPVLNRVMRVMLARQLERPIDEEHYFAARDALVAEGIVGRLRGQGGQVFRVRPAFISVSALRFKLLPAHRSICTPVN